jgi:hypothetical protein
VWHFGADASVEYSGEKFSASWEFYVAADKYCRRSGNKNRTRVRVEVQEYSQTTIENAIRNIVHRGRLNV